MPKNHPVLKTTLTAFSLAAAFFLVLVAVLLYLKQKKEKETLEAENARKVRGAFGYEAEILPDDTDDDSDLD